MKNRISIFHTILAFAKDESYSANTALWKQLYEKEKLLHPIDFSRAKLYAHEILQGDLSAMHKTIAVWLCFDIKTFRTRETFPSDCFSNDNPGARLNDTFEIDKNDLRAVLAKNGLKMPRGLDTEELVLEPEVLVERLKSEGLDEGTMLRKICDAYPTITNYKLGKMFSKYGPGHAESPDAARKRGQRLRKKHNR